MRSNDWDVWLYNLQTIKGKVVFTVTRHDGHPPVHQPAVIVIWRIVFSPKQPNPAKVATNNDQQNHQRWFWSDGKSFWPEQTKTHQKEQRIEYRELLSRSHCRDAVCSLVMLSDCHEYPEASGNLTTCSASLQDIWRADCFSLIMVWSKSSSSKRMNNKKWRFFCWLLPTMIIRPSTVIGTRRISVSDFDPQTQKTDPSSSWNYTLQESHC